MERQWLVTKGKIFYDNYGWEATSTEIEYKKNQVSNKQN
jgi:hypothetical protein